MKKAIQVLEKEKEWCEKNEHPKGEEYGQAFIEGVECCIDLLKKAQGHQDRGHGL